MKKLLAALATLTLLLAGFATPAQATHDAVDWQAAFYPNELELYKQWTNNTSISNPACGLVQQSDAPLVQFLWLYSDGTGGDRFDTFRADFRESFRRMNSIFQASSDGHRSVRTATDYNEATGQCYPTVIRVKVPDSMIPATSQSNGSEQFHPIVDHLRAIGINRQDRLYVALTQNDKCYGEAAEGVSDEQPGPSNASNLGPRYSVHQGLCHVANPYTSADGLEWKTPVGTGWAHEIMHMMGAVNTGAPHYNHTTNTKHCNLGNDPMCYGSGNQNIECTAGKAKHRLDCRKDDYWNVAEVGHTPSDYLSSNWNTSNSSFLHGGQLHPVYAQ